MPESPATIVDIHSHVFNADDLPIDGFVKKLFSAPALVTGILSVPLDRLTQWRAPGDELLELLRLLGPGAELEGAAPDVVVEDPLVTDAELEAQLAAEWQRFGLLPEAPAPDGLESMAPPPTDAQLEDALAAAPPAAVRELEAWLEDIDPAFAAMPADDGLEIFGGVFGKVAKLKQAVALFVTGLRLITRYRYQVAAALAETYPSVSLFVPALVDFAATTGDRPSADIRTQIAIHSLVARLSIAGALPGSPNTRIAPFVPFDPYREVAETALKLWDPDQGVRNTYVPFADPAGAGPADRYFRGIPFDPARARTLREPKVDEFGTPFLDLAGVTGAVDLVRHAIERGGFLGVKMYPPAGFLPLGNALRFGGTKGEQLDAALRALYAYCVALDVPILTHAAHSNGFDDSWNSFAGPDGWELVLAEFPSLRVCLGHFGHFHGVGVDGANPLVDGWPTRFVRLIDTYPHVYADVGNSKFPIAAEYRTAYLSLLESLLGGASPTEAQQKRRRRLLYGSDYWMNTLSPGHEGFLDSFRTSIGDRFGAGMRDAFMGGNALRFLGIHGEDDGPDFANRNRQRFVAFHGSQPLPAWLPAGP